MEERDEYDRGQDTLDALITTLQTVPQAHASLVHSQARAEPSARKLDAEVDLAVAGQNLTLLIELKKTVYPRDTREIIWQLSHYINSALHADRDNVIPFVAAESISIGARELLKAENVGFFDTGGSLFVPAKAAYLYIERPVPRTWEKSVRSLFTGKRSQVLHALLTRPRDWLGGTELARLAEVSPATASETLTALDRMGWISARGHGPAKARRLSDPSGLLDEWRTQVLAARRSLTRRRYYVPGGESASLAHRLAELCAAAGVEYALTQEAAAQLYAPFLSSLSRVACRMVPGKIADETLMRLGARPVSEGANLDVIETKSRGEFLFRELKDSIWLASPVQVYLDLLRSEGRSRDLAEHLRKDVLGI
jgi:hypothetical protein